MHSSIQTFCDSYTRILSPLTLSLNKCLGFYSELPFDVNAVSELLDGEQSHTKE